MYRYMYSILTHIHVCHTHLSIPHVEVDWFLCEVVKNEAVERLRNDLCQEPLLALDQPQEHG